MRSALFYCFAAFVLLAPLSGLGGAALALPALQIAAVGFLVAIVARQDVPVALPRALLVGLGILVLYPLVQLVPLPDALWRAIPGHEPYVVVLDRFARSASSWAWRAISIVPAATERGWLALLPPLACLLVVLRLDPRQLRTLLLAMVALAGVEALLGIVQALGGDDAASGLRLDRVRSVAVGTLADGNQLAAMLAMSLPVAVGWLAYTVRHGRHLRMSRPRQSSLPRLSWQRAVVVIAAALMLACLLYTRSRVGVGVALVGFACSTVVLTHLRTRNTGAWRFAPYLIGAGILLATIVAISPILGRLEPPELTAVAAGREELSIATLQAAADFLPFGSGLSTFADVFPRYQGGKFGGQVPHAGNDYLQALMELGMAAPAIVALLLSAFVARMIALLRVEGSSSLTLLQLGAGMGMVPMILYATFDPALHAPAIAMWFATLAGALFHRGGDSTGHGDTPAPPTGTNAGGEA